MEKKEAQKNNELKKQEKESKAPKGDSKGFFSSLFSKPAENHSDNEEQTEAPTSETNGL